MSIQSSECEKSQKVKVIGFSCLWSLWKSDENMTNTYILDGSHSFVKVKSNYF